MIYHTPLSRLIPINNQENIAASGGTGNETSQDTPKPADTKEEKEALWELIADETYTEQTSSDHPNYHYGDDTIRSAEQNTRILNDIIKNLPGENRVIKLVKGVYPVMPTIDIDNCTLDLNGSTLYSVSYKHEGRLFGLTGERAELCNGEIVGTYDTADDEPEYSFHERESLVASDSFHYDYIRLENLNLHNCWGYAISGYGGADVSLINDHVAPLRDDGVDTDGYRAWTAVFDSSVPGKSTTVDFLSAIAIGHHKYITAIGGVGYQRIISDKEVLYRFYDRDHTLLCEASDIPRIPVVIPQGTACVEVTIFAKYGKYPNSKDEPTRFRVGLFDQLMTNFSIDNCTIHNNHSLGFAGGHGTLSFADCKSYENGRPFHASTHTKRSTTGFGDIEENATPYIYMTNCTSSDERCLLMDGSYVAHLDGCLGKVTAYRGFTATVKNHVGEVSHFSPSVTKKLILDNVQMQGAYATKVNPSCLTSTGIKSESLFDCLQYYEDFEVHTGHSVTTYYWDKPDSAPRGKVYGEGLTGTLRLRLATVERSPYSGKPTDLHLMLSMAGDAGNKYGVLVASGDCYGVTSNTLLLPDGRMICNSSFDINDNKTLDQTNADAAARQMSGEYRSCKFVVREFIPFKYKRLNTPSVPLKLAFTDCDFTVSGGGRLMNVKFTPGSEIRFVRCTLNGKPMEQYGLTDIERIVADDCTNLTLKSLIHNKL